MKLFHTSERLLSVFLLLALWFGMAPAFAQTLWTAAMGDWFTDSNWSDGIPDSLRHGEINNGGTALIASAGANARDFALGFEALDSGNLHVAGAGALTANALFVGASGAGQLIIQNGGSVSDAYGFIGAFDGGTGTVLVDGIGSTWTTQDNPLDVFSGELYLGLSGTGELTIQNGGIVSARRTYLGRAGGGGVVLVDGPGSTFSSRLFQVAVDGPVALTIRNGGAVLALTSSVGNVGFTNVAGNGTVLVDGADSRWVSEGRLIVGDDANGVLTIQNGATVSSGEGFIGRITGSIGAVLVDGAGSTWLNTGRLEVAEFGNGSLTIQNGGKVSSGSGAIGVFLGSSGTVEVQGVNSQWINTGSLEIVNGTLSVENGGMVLSDGGFVDGTALIDGLGSSWISSGDFAVGFASNGNVTIRNGGTVSSEGFGSIGRFNGAIGSVLVDGVGSTWANDGDVLAVGSLGTGTLDIRNGGVVSSAGGGVGVVAGIGVIAGSSGTVRVDGVGSAWNVSQELFVGGGDIGIGGGQAGGVGLVQITNGGRISAVTTTVFHDGTIIDDGLLVSPNVSILAGGMLGGGGIVVGSVANAGTVRPGDSLGTLRIEGNYNQTATGNLVIGIASLAPAQHGLLSITGGATLHPGSTLSLLQQSNFNLSSSDHMTLLGTEGGLAGTFSTVLFAPGGSLLFPVITYDAFNVYLELAQGNFGDLSNLTPNQQSVADNLDDAVGDPAFDELNEFLVNQQIAALPALFDLIAPEELTAIYTIGFSQANAQTINLTRRLSDIRAGSTGFSSAGFGISGSKNAEAQDREVLDAKQTPHSPVMAARPDNRWGVFVTGTGQFVEVDADFNAPGYEITSGGVTFGIDYRANRNFAFGLYGGYAGGEADLVNDGTIEASGGKLGAYATFHHGAFYIDGIIGGGLNSYDLSRAALLGRAKGETEGSEFNGQIASGFNWKFAGFNFEPRASLHYTNVSFDGLVERGSLAPLRIDGSSEDNLHCALGFKLSRDWRAGRAILRPEIGAAWKHEFAKDRSYDINARLASGAGGVFSVDGPALGRDSALLRAGISIEWSERCAVGMFYDGEIGRHNYDSHTFSGGVRVLF